MQQNWVVSNFNERKAMSSVAVDSNVDIFDGFLMKSTIFPSFDVEQFVRLNHFVREIFHQNSVFVIVLLNMHQKRERN